MSTEQITCPNCQHKFELTAAIEQPIVDRIRAQFAEESRQREESLRERMKALQQQQDAFRQQQEEQSTKRKQEQQQRQEQLEAIARQKEEFEAERRKRERDFDRRSKQLQEELDEKLAERLRSEKKQLEQSMREQQETVRKQIIEEEKKRLADEQSAQIKALQEEAATAKERAKKAADAELELIRQRNELKEKEEAFELELARKMEAERDQIRSDTRKRLDEEHRLKEAEKDKQMADLRKQIDDLRRKADQGSQQNQGEVLELELEEALRTAFPQDVIEPVPKGVRGADVLQQVRDERGQLCGTIIWESKRTKAWNNDWLGKLKDDQIACKADIPAIVTTTLPEDLGGEMARREGVWVTHFGLAAALASALRLTLHETAAVRRAAIGKQDKMEFLYDYLSGPEFKRRVEAIVEAFSDMKTQIDKEKRAMAKHWSAREKQLDRVLTNTAGMYGDITGLIGSSMPTIPLLELDGD